MPSRYIIFNKPFQVLTQFTDDNGRKTLKDFVDIPGVYSAGRLDYDSEGLLILTDDGQLIHSMMDPQFKVPKTYLAQVEGIPSDDAIEKLKLGLELKDGKTRPCQANLVDEPHWIWPRNSPIRERKAIPTQWIQLTITEGRNRQVRRMTAAVGHPTLRLVRHTIANVSVNELQLGEYREVNLAFLEDNGIKLLPKKGGRKTASSRKGFRRSDSRQDRNQRPRHRSRKA